MSVTIDGTNGIISPGGDEAAVSVKTPLVTNNGTLALSATGSNVITAATNGSERMRIDSAGRLLVGATSTSETTTLLVQGNSLGATQNGAIILARGEATPPNGSSLGSLDFSANNHILSARVVARRDGGTWTAGSSQPSRLEFSTTANGSAVTTERMRIASNGTITFNAYGAGTLSTNASGVISASDGRYKTKTRPVENGLDAIAALQPTYFKWDEDSPFASENEELGFIAQEVAAAIPEASPGEDEEGKYRNYHDRAIIAMLVKGMQEQQAIIESLTARIEALENQDV